MKVMMMAHTWTAFEQILFHGDLYGSRGSSIYDVHKKIRFFTPPLVPMRSHEIDPYPL